MTDTLLDQKTQQNKNEMSKWLKSLSLNQIEQNRSKVEDILGIDYETLKQKTAMELGEYAFVIAQYSLFIQHKNNEIKTFLQWSKRIMNTIDANDRARLLKWTQIANDRLEMINYFTRRLEVISQSLSNLSRIKFREN